MGHWKLKTFAKVWKWKCAKKIIDNLFRALFKNTKRDGMQISFILLLMKLSKLLHWAKMDTIPSTFYLTIHVIISFWGKYHMIIWIEFEFEFCYTGDTKKASRQIGNWQFYVLSEILDNAPPAPWAGCPLQADSNPRPCSWESRGAFHQAFCQWFSLTNFISYWNPSIWLAESKFVSENHWQNAWWNAPQD